MLLTLLLPGCFLWNKHSEHETDIIEKLQKEVPFTIVVPTHFYFPKGILPYPTGGSEPGEGSVPDSLVIGLTYAERTTNNNVIWIFEENHTANPVPSQPSSIYLDIGGIRVLEEEIEMYNGTSPSEPSDDSEVFQGIIYAWNRDGIRFDVLISGYGKSECRKVIESMIIQ